MAEMVQAVRFEIDTKQLEKDIRAAAKMAFREVEKEGDASLARRIRRLKRNGLI